MYRYL